MSKFSTKGLSKKYAGIFTPTKKGTKYSASSFWLDDDFLDDIAEAKSKKKEIDIVKLSGYRRAIGNFVRIVTGRDDIPVNYTSGDNSFTDGKAVTISAKLSENEFDSTVGLALHEGSHILLTDFKALPNFFNSTKGLSYSNSEHLVIKDLINIIEDRRIDNYVYQNAPGYRSYYQALYDKFFNSKDIDQALIENIWSEETYENYINHICNFANPHRNLNALTGLRTIWDLIDIKNIKRLKSTTEVIDIACAVHDEILKHTSLAKSPKKNGGDGDGAGEPGNTNDPAAGTGEAGDAVGSGNSYEPEPTLTPKEQAKLDKLKKAAQKALANQKEFLCGNIKKGKVSKKDAKALKAAQDSSMSYAIVGGEDKTPGAAGINYTRGNSLTKCLIVRGMPDSLMSGEALSHIRSKWVADREQISINEGIVLGTLLGKRLKTRDEVRTLTTSRLSAGRIDKRLVSELGYGNERVFYKKVVDTVNPAMVHISLDASGSMSGANWRKAIKTATAIAKAASMVQSLECIVSVRGSNDNLPVMWVAYDSRKDGLDVIRNKFALIDANGSTPEGLCFEAIMKDILESAKGKEMYFINLSDGEPGFSNGEINYGGQFALDHTRRQIDKMKRAGINVLSYFITERPEAAYVQHSIRKFMYMYGKESKFIDVESLNALAISLNSLFERKAA